MPGVYADLRGSVLAPAPARATPTPGHPRSTAIGCSSCVAAGPSSSAALIVLADPLTARYRAPIVEHAAKRRLPTMYGFREFVEAGGLMA